MARVNARPPVIAVLDDDAAMRQALRRLLGANGYEVLLFADGETLLTTSATPPPDCLLLDLHMPGLDGFSVLEQLGRREQAPPVIVITGHDAPGNHDRVAALGATAYLLKPVDEAPLVAAIARSLQGSRAGVTPAGPH